MKILSAATLLVALFIASMITTSVSVLSDLDQPSKDIRIEDLNAGQLVPMLSGPTLWNQYPSFPPVTALVEVYAMCLVGGLVAATVYILRIKLRKPLVVASIASLMLGAFPYAQGLFVLQASKVEASEVGPWVALMLLGVFYASLAAAVLASADLTGWHKKALTLLKSAHSRTDVHSSKRQLQEAELTARC